MPRNDDPPKTSIHGSTIRPLSEGYIRKGGLNPPTSQVSQRPPAPAAMRPSTPPSPRNGGNPGGNQGSGK